MSTEKTVTMVYFAQVTFDEEAQYTKEGFIEEALHNVAQNVRSATEYTDFGWEENFEAILLEDDDIDINDLRLEAAEALIARINKELGTPYQIV